MLCWTTFPASLVQLKSSAKKKKPRVLQISDDEESRDVTDVTLEKPVEEEPSTCTAEATQADKTQDRGLFKEPDDDLFVPFSRTGTQAPPAQVSDFVHLVYNPAIGFWWILHIYSSLEAKCISKKNMLNINWIFLHGIA